MPSEIASAGSPAISARQSAPRRNQPHQHVKGRRRALSNGRRPRSRYGRTPASRGGGGGEANFLIGSAPASGEFHRKLFVGFQANDASHVLFVASSSQRGTHNNLTTAIGSLSLLTGSGLLAPLLYAWAGFNTVASFPLQHGNLVPDCRFSSTIRPCQTRLKSSSLLTTARDASISAISTSNARAERYRPSASNWRRCGKMLKRPNSMIAGGLDRRTIAGNCRPCFRRKSQTFAGQYRRARMTMFEWFSLTTKKTAEGDPRPILDQPDAAQKLVLADHRPRRLNRRHQNVEGAAAEPYRPAVGQDPETAALHHRERRRRGEIGAMIQIYVFEENHRFSD